MIDCYEIMAITDLRLWLMFYDRHTYILGGEQLGRSILGVGNRLQIMLVIGFIEKDAYGDGEGDEGGDGDE